MIWENILKEIFQHNSIRIFCLHSQKTPQTSDLRDLKEAFSKNYLSGKGFSLDKIILLPTRAHYINRHKHEGLFFQQRYQSSYNDQGETVRQRLMASMEKNSVLSIDRWMDWFELEEIWDKPLLQLSSGEWQRFSLCEGLMAKPGILIAPELLKGLDHRWQQKILTVLSKIIENGGMIVFTSDIPADYPFVNNINIYPGSTDQRTIQVPKISESFLKTFHIYQSGFLPESLQDILVRMNGVDIRYGNHKILDDIHWTVHAGDKWNIQGANGAGKSTLISLINADNPQGYSQPIELFGEKYGRYSIWERKARIAYFGSDYFHYFRSSKSLEDVLRYQFKTPYLNTTQPSEPLISELLSYFGLDKFLHASYSTVPGDIKRQTLLLAAYLKSSDVLVLDEPYQDLSYERIQLNNRFLNSVQQNSLQTVLFVTHREDHKPGFLDQELKLREGRVVF